MREGGRERGKGREREEEGEGAREEERGSKGYGERASECVRERERDHMEANKNVLPFSRGYQGQRKQSYLCY